MMRVKSTACALVLAGLGAFVSANAGEVTGAVTQVLVRDSDGLVYVHTSGTSVGRPSCAVNTSYWMVPNESSETGKKLYALLLSAQLADRPVRIVGKNTCNRWVDGEDILFVQLL